MKLRRQGPAAMSRLISTFAIILCIAAKVLVSASPVTLFGDEHYGDSDDGVSNDGTNEDSDDEEDDSVFFDNPEERGSLLEGDMILPPKALNGLVDENFRWPQSTVPYVVDFKFRPHEREIINLGIQDILTRTCIQITPRTDEPDYVFVQRGEEGTGCSSSVGRVGGVQVLNLNPQCLLKVGTVTHEFLHALGLRHEQSRSDRDNYVDIQWDNIKDESVNNFKKYGEGEVDSFGVPYDYGSVMHYSAYGFAQDSSNPTVVPKQTGVVIGQRDHMSEYDALKINRMYNCDLEDIVSDHVDADADDDDVEEEE